MTYDEVVAAAFAPPADPHHQPTPVASGSPARRLRDAVEPLAMHSVWARRPVEALAACGLDFFGAYVGGRAAALGRPAPSVVVATFAVFEPALIAATYEAAAAACDRDRLLAERERATIESLHEVLGSDASDRAEVGAAVAVLRPALERTSRLGRPLFAGVADLPWPDDPAGELWRCCELLREHRGDGHVAALVAAGVDGLEASVLTELWLGGPLGAYSATRGWSAEQLGAATGRLGGRGLVVGGALTEEGRRIRDGIEAATDATQAGLLAAIGDGLDGVVDRLSSWSARCIEARAFPPDPFKRAAG